MIYISAGHYPEKPGACFDGYCEHEEAIEWANLIDTYMGDDSLLVPTGVLKDKVRFINHRKPKAAIEIHFNSASTRKGISGCETLYYPGSVSGIRLATEVQQAMSISIPRNRGIKPGYFRMDIANGVDFFLDKTKCPSLIIEPEFIFNKESIKRHKLATCKHIAEALSKSLEWL